MTTNPTPDRPASHWLRVGPRLLAAAKAAAEFLELIGRPIPPAPYKQLVDAIAEAERTGL